MQTLAGRAAAPAAESGPSATDLSEVHASSVVTLETALITALSEAGPVGPGDAWAPEDLQAWREGTAGSAGAVQAEEAERPRTAWPIRSGEGEEGPDEHPPHPELLEPKWLL